MDMNNNNNFDNGEFSQNPQPQVNPYEQQNMYNQPVYTQPAPPAKDETVSVLDWIGTNLITLVPCVGIIMYIIWAFSKDTKKSKANYCKAMLIMMLIGIVLYIIMIAIFVAAGLSSDMSSYYGY